jgi:hypothetical protein
VGRARNGDARAVQDVCEKVAENNVVGGSART